MADFALEQIDKALAAERKRVAAVIQNAELRYVTTHKFGSVRDFTNGANSAINALKTELGDTTK